MSDDVAFLWRWVLLAGAAGGAAGFLVGGIGGRLAMLVLRLTSSHSVRGVKSDDGFIIGEFSGATIFLLGLTTILGMVAGVACAVLRSQLPGWRGSVLIAASLGLVGAATIIKPDGVDFTELSPLWLACALFTLIPIAAVTLTLWFIALWRRWWWRNTRRTAVAASPWLLIVPAWWVAAPIVGVLLVVGAAALRLSPLRAALTNRVGTTVAALLLATVAIRAGATLVVDLTEIL